MEIINTDFAVKILAKKAAERGTVRGAEKAVFLDISRRWWYYILKCVIAPFFNFVQNLEEKYERNNIGRRLGYKTLSSYKSNIQTTAPYL